MPNQQDNSQISVERNNEINKLYEKFEGKRDVSQSLLIEAGNLLQIKNPVEVGEYQDYCVQKEHDVRMATLMPKVQAAISKLQFFSVLTMTRSFVADAKKNNDDVRVEIAQLIEEAEIPFGLLDNVKSEIGDAFSMVVATAVQTVGNKSGECIQSICKEHFGKESITYKDMADYAKNKFEKAAAKNALDKSAAK